MQQNLCAYASVLDVQCITGQETSACIAVYHVQLHTTNCLFQTHSCGFGKEIKYVANYDGRVLSASSHH